MLSSIRKVSRFPSFKLLNQNTIKSRELYKVELLGVKCGDLRWRSCTAALPVTEITIPIPYGHLAAKVWGEINDRPMLALHGWMDNCGTFDKLIPLLEKSPYIIALDFPGHGLSSHKPPGCFYSYSDLYIAVHYVCRHFNWRKFKIIGHSMGVEIAQVYASLYPNVVEKIVGLDTIKPVSQSSKNIPQNIADDINKNISLEEKLSSNEPVYDEKSILERLIKGMHNEITTESAHILLKRGAKPSKCGKGQVFTRDLRLRTIETYNGMSDEVVKEVLSRITCEMLIIQAENPSIHFTSPTLEFDLTFLDAYREHCKHFEMKSVAGNHFVHLNKPELVAPLVNAFLHNS